MDRLDKTTTTPFGQISESWTGETFITAYGNETHRWATRPGNAWPCSTLSGEHVEIVLASNGDLVDYEGPDDVDVHELNAFVDDVRLEARDRPGTSS